MKPNPNLGLCVALGNRIYTTIDGERREVAVCTKADPVLRAYADGNAEYIAKAINCYAELIEVLGMPAIRAAIAKAEGR